LIINCSSATFDYHIATTDASDTFVILVHGLRAKSTIFQKMEKALLQQGYNVCRVDYPSTEYTIQALADTALNEAVRRCQQAGSDTLYFVGHSMGGILIRYFLQENEVSPLGKVVFISTPHHGTELVNKLAWSKLFQNFNGPGGMQLGAAEDDFIQSLNVPDYDFAVIMSKRSINPVESMLISGKDDGRVPIESARLEGMQDFVLVKTNHHFSMKNDATIKQVISYLKTGQFVKDLHTD
jgi:triacylglycerol esterase/lipase EstA (alpha/beta hydrolase family)